MYQEWVNGWMDGNDNDQLCGQIYSGSELSYKTRTTAIYKLKIRIKLLIIRD